jgi:uncharacterized protein
MSFLRKLFVKDAAHTIPLKVSDNQGSIVNSMTGIGTGRDKSTHSAYQRVILTRKNLIDTYKGSWVAAKGIDTPAEDMTREARVWSELKQEQVDVIETLEKHLRLWEKVTDALKWSRLYGGDALIIGLKPSLGEPNTPVDFAKIKQGDLLYLKPVSMDKLKLLEAEQDETLETFLEPKIWLWHERSTSIGGRRNEIKLNIHDHRIIRFNGRRDPENPLWGMSELQRLYQELMLNSKLVSAISHLSEEIKVDTFLINDLYGMLSDPCGEERLKKIFELIQTQSSYVNGRVLDANTRHERREINFAGIPQIWQEILKQLSGGFDIPITRLFGTSSAGLQSTGEGDMKNYYASIAKMQENVLRPALEKLDRVLLPACGIKDIGKASFKFGDLFIESEEQHAKTAAVWSGIAKTLSESGLFSEADLQKAIASKLDETGLLKIETGNGLNAAIAA